MITRLYLENFRAFERLDIPLSKINCFFGPNNSGKSAIISAINVLSQTLDSADRDVPLLLNGKFEELGTYRDTVYEQDLNRNMKIGLDFIDYEPDSDEPLSVRFEVSYHYRKQRREIVINGIVIHYPLDNLLLKTRVSKRGNTQIVEAVSSEYTRIRLGPSSSGTIVTNHFIPNLSPTLTRPWLFRRTYRRHVQKRREDYNELDFEIYEASRIITNHLSKIEFIGPFRSRPERTYSFSGEAPSSVGASGDKCIDILASDQSRRKGKRKNIAQKVSNWLRQSEIAREIYVVPLTDRHFEIYVSHIHTGEQVNIADSGFGISQILPILVAGYFVPSNSTFIMEEPEIHLHPKAQSEIGTFLLDVSNNNVQIFVETHSEHLLLRLQRHIACGELKPEDVNVFYVYSQEEKRGKIEKLIPIGLDGYFTEEWPQGFFPERLREAEKIAKRSL